VDDEEVRTPIWQPLLGIGVVLSLGYGFLELIQAVDPGPVKAPDDPGVLELLVANRTVLTVLRIALVFGLGYLIWSVFRLMKEGRFLTQLPGVSVSDAAEVAQGEADWAVEEVQRLEAALEEANGDIATLVEYVQRLQEDLQMDEDAAEQGDELGGTGTTPPATSM
jgi:hypothetical protein